MKALHPNAKVPKTNGFVLKEVPSSYRRKKASTNRALSEGGLGEAVVEAVKKKFGVDGSERVLESFRRIREGIEFEKMHEGKGLQIANSYIEGLEPIPFHEVKDFPWMMELEKHSETIRKEFILRNAQDLSKGNRIWETALTVEAFAYGRDWRTLVLQDRGRWDPINAQLFPRTVEIVKKSNAPTSEVFFAKQAPHTGIEPHTDWTNFVLTGHLALIVPEGECFMQVGEERRCWEEGKGLIMDTSFVHSTRNDTDETRYVLITRFWHPALAKEERKALQFIFDCLDDPTVLERGTATQAVMQAKTKRALRGKSQQRKKQGGSRRKR